MDKIVKLLEDVFVIPGSTNVGVLVKSAAGKKIVYLIDSGCTEIDGEYVLDTLESFFGRGNYSVDTIINTHSHADHCGGDKTIQLATGCKIWAPYLEKGSMENPLLQGSIIWGGYPPHELQTVYYKTEPLQVDFSYSEKDSFIAGKNTVNFIFLPGHYYETMGILVTGKEDKKILFAGDSIFTRGELGKYWIPFLINYSQFLESVDKINDIKNLTVCVPGHGDVIYENIAETVELNKIAILSTRQCIIDSLAAGPLTTEQLIKAVTDKNEIKMKLSQYILIGSTLKSYFAVLHDEGILKIKIEDNFMYWTL